MASGGRESSVFSSDDEALHPVEKHRRKPKALVSSDSDDDSDFEVKPRKNVKPLDCESEDSIDNFNNDATYPSETRFCSNTEEDFSAMNDTSDNEQSEKCAICLSKFSGQDIATPETCDHMFCLECLQEWAKNVNTCPIDRLKFNLILIRHHKEEKIFKRINFNFEKNVPSSNESSWQFSRFKCQYCPYGTNITSHLKYHIFTHTGERPFLCKLCNRGFPNPSSLFRHMSLHKDTPTNSSAD